MNPLVSIITATFNNAETLQNAIESVDIQTYPNIEYIIVDGKSTDNTLDIANRYTSTISQVISEPDSGIYDALNKGITLASGEIITLLHADDFYANKNVVQNMVDVLQADNADAAYADLLYVNKQDPDKIIRNWISGKYNITKLINGWMPPHPTLFIRKKIFDQIGLFDKQYIIAADYDFILRMLWKHKAKLAYFPEATYIMRVGGKSNKSLNNILYKSKEDFLIMRKNELPAFRTLIMKNLSKVSQYFNIK